MVNISKKEFPLNINYNPIVLLTFTKLSLMNQQKYN